MGIMQLTYTDWQNWVTAPLEEGVCYPSTCVYLFFVFPSICLVLVALAPTMTRCFTSFQRLKWLQTKMHTTSNTISW